MLFLAVVMASSLGSSQEIEKSQAASKKSSGSGNAYIVQLTEFRMKKSDVHVSASEIIKLLDEMKDNGDIEVIETIRLSALPSYESMIQIGRRATITAGTMDAPGRGQTRLTQHQEIGTTVRLTAEPSGERTLLKLSYEAIRLEGEASDDIPPDTTAFEINTAMLLEPSKTVLVGGTSADSSAFLAVSVE